VTAPHYGKRNLGLGTAASPGDSLLFNFASFNDSGDSEVLSGFAVSDIEVIKDGSATVRATDSGYSLISDTGMVGDRAGLYRFRIQLFNTADDASFYANGSWYQVFVDSVTIDGKTVRFWAGSFEIGEPRANIVQVDGDTGFADRLGKFASLLSAAGQIDTGTVSGGFIPANVRQINSDTGAAVHLAQVYADGFTDTGLYNRLDRIQSDVDTGLRDHITNVDTGLTNRLNIIASDVDTGLRTNTTAIKAKTDSLTFTVAGVVDANIEYVNATQIQGTGDTGTANTWRPV
jgi:hypothetical protein